MSGQSNMVLGMALLNDIPRISFKKIVSELQNKYTLNVTEQDIDDANGVGVIQLKGFRVAIGLMDLPIPGDELELPIQISYIWPDAKNLIPHHRGHIIISVTSAGDSRLGLYKTFTKVAAAVLTSTNAFGIYMGSQTLVLPTDFFVDGANAMTDESLPLMNWIYVGVTSVEGKNSGYTFGLKEFGLDEIEILKSDHSLEDIHGMLVNVAHYVIKNDVRLNDGETLGQTEEEKLELTRSEGVQLDGTTLKIKY